MKIVISGSGLYTPEEIISNAELVDSYNQYVQKFNKDNEQAIAEGVIEEKQESSAEFIQKASGIEKRHVYEKHGILDIDLMSPIIERRSPEQQSIQCEMGVAAAKQAMKEAKKTAADIDSVIVSCTYLQRAYPAIAIEIQQALGIEGYAFDMSVACSSATFAIQNAVNAIASGNAKCVLIVNPELFTPQVNFRDRSSHFIFGDMATALIVEKAEQASSQCQYQIVDSQMKTLFSNNIRCYSGHASPNNVEIDPLDTLFFQEGRKVFKEVTPLVANFIVEHLQKNDLKAEHIRRLWLHQANSNMNRLISKKILGRDATASESPNVLHKYANTSSAGAIATFHEHKQDLAGGHFGLLSSFGAGYSVGSVILQRH